jgi:hypothetical protein
MAKRTTSAVEFQRFDDTTRVVNGNVEVISRMLSETPASACARQAEKLRALAALISGAGFETFTGLETQLQDNLMLLLGDLVDCVANLAGLAAEAEAHHG